MSAMTTSLSKTDNDFFHDLPSSRVDFQGNARVLWQIKAPGEAIWGVPSPDGRYLATVGGVYNSNVWMIEGFGPRRWSAP
jgi:hypothetical protein